MLPHLCNGTVHRYIDRVTILRLVEPNSFELNHG